MLTLRRTLPTTWPISPAALIGAVYAAVVLAALSVWGGSAHPSPLLGLGIALMSGSLAAFALVTWWLFLSPLPTTPTRQRTTVSSSLVQRVAILAAVGGLGTQVATLWDDAWHRRFGGFGDDFLWPPHLLIYLSLGFIAVCGMGSLALTLRRGDGDVRLRFRSSAAVGLTGLVAGFMVVLLPSDAVWHAIYGLDITAWSPPHLVAAVNFSLVLLAAATAQLSLVPPGDSRSLRGITPRELVAVAALGLATLELVQIGLTEWDGQDVLAHTAGPGFAAAFAARPVWLYPVVVVTIATFVGQLALHAVRRAGVATFVGLGVLAFRVACLALLDAWNPAIGMGYISHLLLLPPMLTLDLCYLRHLSESESLRDLLVGTALAAGVGLVAAAVWMPAPRLTPEVLPGLLVVGGVVSLAAGYCGAHLGSWLATWHRRPV
jgi:hypothetical protein